MKLTNTLVVENDGDFLPASEPKKYLSGGPLHVLAMHLVRRFRREFGSRLPVSFSGDRGEFFHQEDFKGRIIFVRYVWLILSPNSSRMEQSFSPDGGKT